MEKLQSLIRIRYGPYESHGTVRHRTQRLRGIEELLARRSVPVTIVPSFHHDRLEVEIAGEKIFQCRLTALDYNSDGIDDPLCHQITDTIMEAMQRIIPSLYDYHDILNLYRCAGREAYLQELSLFHRCIVESLLDDVILSGQQFCQNIVQQIIEDALNFKENMCRQIAEDALTSAIEQIVHSEAIEICTPIALSFVDQAHKASEPIYVMEDVIDHAETTIFMHDVVQDITDEAYLSTRDGRSQVCKELLDDIVEKAGEEAYSTSKGRTITICRDVVKEAVEKALEEIDNLPKEEERDEELNLIDYYSSVGDTTQTAEIESLSEDEKTEVLTEVSQNQVDLWSEDHTIERHNEVRHLEGDEITSKITARTSEIINK